MVIGTINKVIKTLPPFKKIVVLTGVVINIPLAVYLGKLYGLPGIVSANTITFFWMAMVYTIQYKKIASQTALVILNE